jgi:uncharacterized membrane protein (GlpM family)
VPKAYIGEKIASLTNSVGKTKTYYVEDCIPLSHPVKKSTQNE